MLEHKSRYSYVKHIHVTEAIMFPIKWETQRKQICNNSEPFLIFNVCNLNVKHVYKSIGF
jgi:hypothetical protein